MQDKKPLQGQVALVTGATRGAGRGIAVELGAAGATVYCTGRSVRGNTTGRPETIEETAELVTAAGGVGIAVRVDHTVPVEVEALFARIDKEQSGRLDLLVNDVWGGDELTNWETPFWKHNLPNGLRMQEQAVHSHIITSYYAAPLMLARKQGLILEITDGDDLKYRGTLFYDLAKVSVIRLAHSMAEDLRPHGVTAIGLTPGFLRSEAMLEHFGITEENWNTIDHEEWGKLGGRFSETPRYIGRAVVALASDPDIAAKSGKTFATWTLVDEYGFTDVNGTRPKFPDFFASQSSQ
jgi:NAD(P)-dependent dehydrogenase (short-subunit alcohol dehydrogenase family)